MTSELSKLFTRENDAEQRDHRIEQIRREFNVPLLDAADIEDKGMAISDAVFLALQNATDVILDSDRHKMAAVVHGLRIVAVNADVCQQVINDVIPCQCSKCAATRRKAS